MKLRPNTSFQFTTRNSQHTHTCGVGDDLDGPPLVCVVHKEGDTYIVDLLLKIKEAQQHIDEGRWTII